MKFGHIGIKVLDLDRSIAFYTNILSAKLLKDYVYPTSRLVFMEIGGTIVELIAKPENEERAMGPIEHIAFKVDDFEEKLKMLESYGVEYTAPRIVGSAKVVFFDGPNNERFEFVGRVQCKEAASQCAASIIYDPQCTNMN